MSFTTVLNLLGIGRVEHLIYKCRPELNGKIENVKVYHVPCERCGRPNVFEWEYEIDGRKETYSVSKICSNCMKGKIEREISEEIEQRKAQYIADKWYRIEDEDNSGFRNYETYNSATKKAQDEAIRYTKTILSGQAKNLLMMGSTGTGKTHLAKTIAKTRQSERTENGIHRSGGPVLAHQRNVRQRHELPTIL